MEWQARPPYVAIIPYISIAAYSPYHYYIYIVLPHIGIITTTSTAYIPYHYYIYIWTGFGSLVEAINSTAGALGGPVLGVFLAGLIAPRVCGRAALAGFAAGTATCGIIMVSQRFGFMAGLGKHVACISLPPWQRSCLTRPF